MTQHDWELWLQWLTGQGGVPPGSHEPGLNPLDVMIGE